MIKIHLETYGVGTGGDLERPFFLSADAAPDLPVDDDLMPPEPVGEAAFQTLYDDLGHGSLFGLLKSVRTP